MLRAGGVRDEQLDLAFQVIDKAERAPRDELAARLEGAGIAGGAADRVFRTAEIRGRAALEAELASLPGGMEAGEPLFRTVGALEAMGMGAFVDIDLTIVRGLAYYTGTVFELFDAARSLRAICGGGRYDTLLGSLGGVDLPALGFGMGDVVLAELLREKGRVPVATSSIDVFVAAVGPGDEADVLALAHELRNAGFRCEFALGGQALGRQLKLADARNARHAVVVGPEERARGEVVVKDLQGKDQRTVARSALVDALAAGRAARSA